MREKYGLEPLSEMGLCVRTCVCVCVCMFLHSLHAGRKWDFPSAALSSPPRTSTHFTMHLYCNTHIFMHTHAYTHTYSLQLNEGKNAGEKKKKKTSILTLLRGLSQNATEEHSAWHLKAWWCLLYTHVWNILVNMWVLNIVVKDFFNYLYCPLHRIKCLNRQQFYTDCEEKASRFVARQEVKNQWCSG